MSNKAITRAQAAIVIVVVVIAVAAGAYLTTPGPGPTPTPTTTTGPAFKDTLIIGSTDSVQTTLDPSDAYDFLGDNLITQALSSPLIDFVPGSAAGPNDLRSALATDWTVSSDGLTYTFNLRQGVKFADGSCCFNATIVKYSFDRGIKLNNPDGPFVGVGLPDRIKSVDVMSPYQVVFHLTGPWGPFLSVMAFAPAYPVNPTYAPMATVNYTAGDARHSTPLDFGPYVLTSWTRVAGKDTEIRLDKNPNYWNASGGYPKTPHIIIRFYSDATALRLAIQSGEVDIAFRQLRATDIKDLATNPALKVWKGTGAHIRYLVFQEKIKPFDDPRVRRAIAAAVDRNAIISTVFLGQYYALYSLIPIGMVAHQDVFKLYGDANYTYTKTVLAQLGYSETKKLAVDLWYESSGHYEASADIAAVMKSSLEASGVIQVNLHNTDWASYRANLRANSMPAYVLGWYPDYIDPDDYMYPFIHTGSFTRSNYANPQADQVVEQAGAASGAERVRLYGIAQQILVTDAPIVPLFQGSATAISKPNVGGIVLDVTTVFRYYLLYATTTAT